MEITASRDLAKIANAKKYAWFWEIMGMLLILVSMAWMLVASLGGGFKWSWDIFLMIFGIVAGVGLLLFGALRKNMALAAEKSSITVKEDGIYGKETPNPHADFHLSWKEIDTVNCNADGILTIKIKHTDKVLAFAYVTNGKEIVDAILKGIANNE